MYARHVRRVGTIASGAATYAVPARPRVTLSRTCMARLSPRQRRVRRGLARRIGRTVILCLDDFENGGESACVSAADGIKGRTFTSADGPEAPGGQNDQTHLPTSTSALAPDGAATLEAHYPGQAPITAPVSDNFATFVHTITIAPDAHRFPNFNPAVAIYRRADGSVLLSTRPHREAPEFGGP